MNDGESSEPVTGLLIAGVVVKVRAPQSLRQSRGGSLRLDELQGHSVALTDRNVLGALLLSEG